MKKAFVYLRVSSRGQAKQGKDGFPRQEKAVRTYAKANGLHIERLFREDITGTETNRPVLADLMVSLEKNDHGVRTVIIEKLDRLARDLMVQEAIVRDFHRQGFNLISAAEGNDLASTDPTRKLVRQVLGAIAEYDKTMTVEKLRVARDRKRAETGRCEGRPGFGETDAERAALRRMRAWRRRRRGGHKGLTYQAIADRLNAEGTLTKDGHQWTAPRVYAVMKRTAQ